MKRRPVSGLMTESEDRSYENLRGFPLTALKAGRAVKRVFKWNGSEVVEMGGLARPLLDEPDERGASEAGPSVTKPRQIRDAESREDE